MKRALNIGSGRQPEVSTEEVQWTNLDMARLPEVDVYFNLEMCGCGKRMPFADNTFDHIQGVHVVEHLEEVLAVFQELWRITKADGTCRVALPYGSSDDAWADPTHVRPWFRGSWDYLDARSYWRADYGYLGDWEHERIILHIPMEKVMGESPPMILNRVDRERNLVTEMEGFLRCVKPARAPEGQPTFTQNIELDIFG